jgi:CRISPR system Cascade subunit CasB
MTEATPSPATTPALASVIARLAAVICETHYPNADRAALRHPNGDRAALRRWAPGQPVPLAFYRLWLQHLGHELPADRYIEAWMTLAWGLATCGTGCHDPQRPLGQALAESRFSEGRLERLLSAPDDVRLDLFMSAVRFLAARGERFDWHDAALFLLTTDADKRERLSRRIASHYYRHLPQD